jgi:hypothetical protein
VRVRLLLVWLSALLLTAPATRASAQAPAPGRDSGAVQPAGAALHAEAAKLIASVRSDPNAVGIPPLSRFTAGARTVAAGTTEPGPVAVVDGRLDVRGTVTGDAIAVNGDVVVHQGARVTGDAFAARGRVILNGGVVDGEIRTLSGDIGPVMLAGRAGSSAGSSVWRDLKLSLGWLAVLLAIGFGVLVSASSYLNGVAEALERSYTRALLTGIVGQLSVLPALLLVVLGLGITIIGILVIPLAIVAFVLGLAGLLTLGFLAVALVTGRSLERRHAPGEAQGDRNASVRALVLGVSLYLFLWIAAAALGAWPAVAVALRVVAVAMSWVAVTAGFGATLISRAGTRRIPAVDPLPLPEPDVRPATARAAAPVWQTPTPISGVVAARRPTSSAPPASE